MRRSESGIDLVHVRHEAAAVHMADAWARTTGEVGVALVTGGAGHANAIGALCTAAASESPVLLLSGHAALDEIGLGAFQEMRQADLAEPVTKASWTARSAAGLADDIARAMRIARSGRPGPVHVSLALRRAGTAVSMSPRSGRRLRPLRRSRCPWRGRRRNGFSARFPPRNGR